MAIEGVDYSWARPDPACLFRSGKRFAVRYCGPGSSGKRMTKAEVAHLVAAGLAVVSSAEGFARDPLLGYAKGQDHARSAMAEARAAGMPPSKPIYFAVDFDMVTSQRSVVQRYFEGIKSVIGLNRTGIYGGIRTINWAKGGGHAAWFWQTYAWSGGQWSPYCHLQQYRNGVRLCGGDVDLTRAVASNYGAWKPGVETTGEAPPSPPDDQGAGPWDFTDIIDDLGFEWVSLAGALNAHARAVDALRT